MIPHINYLHTQVRLPRHLEQLPINVENPQKIQNAPQTVTERRASARSGNVIQVNTPGNKNDINIAYYCSGYPGVIYSGDDFTVASSGLTILETTIGNSNKHLWQYVQVRMAIIFTKIFRNVSRLRGQYWRESGQLWQTGWQLTGTPGRRSSLGTTAELTTTSGWWSTTTSSTPGR